MAQGASKAKSVKSGSIGSAKKKAGKTRPGKREVAPKAKAKIVAKSQEKTIQLNDQKLSTKINESIEKQMVQAASAGKLTIMKSKGDLAPGAGKGKAKA